MFYKRFTSHDFLQVVFIFKFSYKAFLIFGIKDVIWLSVYFQNKDTVTLG